MQATPKAARKTVVVRASMENEGVQSRRAALALAAAAVIGLGAAESAQAVTAAKSASSKYFLSTQINQSSALAAISMISFLTCFLMFHLQLQARMVMTWKEQRRWVSPAAARTQSLPRSVRMLPRRQARALLPPPSKSKYL